MKQWDLTKIYASNEAWETELEKFKSELPRYEEYKGKLSNKDMFKEFITFNEYMDKFLSDLYVYAYQSYDINQKDSDMLSLYNLAYQAYCDYSVASSFVASEYISIGQETINKWIAEDEDLKCQQFPFDKLFLSQANILDAKSELLISNYQGALGNYNKLYDQLATVDNTSKTVTLSTGETVEISQSNYRSYLESLDNQDDRRIVFEAVFEFFHDHQNTFAGIYSGIIQVTFGTLKNRNYANFLECFLKSNNIPTSIYTTLVETCRSNTEAIKKYYELLRSHHNLDEIHTYDRFLKLASSDEKFDYEQAKDLFFKSIEKIGGEFALYARNVLEPGRVDVEIRPGKRTGAYSTGYYHHGPYILLNHDNRLDDVFTLAHEAGHSMHTLYANLNQPYATSNYKIFVAEIASTFNEQLLLDYLLETTHDKNLKIVLLQMTINGILGTFYRQTLFASYEYEAFKQFSEGLIPTAASLGAIMSKLYMDYYGIDLANERFKDAVWAYIPHFFHSPFYVYQYATSYAASALIYANVKNKKPQALENYIELLKAGDSDFPVELVKQAGVDLTTPEPFLAVVERLAALVDELEKALK